MPPFAGVLKPNEISAVADFARSLSGLPTEAGADLELGKKVFAANCAVCHGPEGKGNLELGSANLTDKIWLYGSDKAAIVDGVEHGRGGVMPTWEGRLSEPTVKALTVYVWSFGGGTK
jgi:cytochrome c oxidase cbb3-type subunit 3